MSDEIKEIKDEEQEKMNGTGQQLDGQESTVSNSGSGKNAWIPGIVLIGLGLVFLVSNVTGFYLSNWWALFILIPGIVNLVNAWNAYREDGRATKRVRGSLIGGLIICLVAVIFLFNLDWGRVWPLFLILGGIALLFGGRSDR